MMISSKPFMKVLKDSFIKNVFPYYMGHIGYIIYSSFYTWVYNFHMGFQLSEANDGTVVKYYPSNSVNDSWNSKYAVLNRMPTQMKACFMCE